MLPEENTMLPEETTMLPESNKEGFSQQNGLCTVEKTEKKHKKLSTTKKIILICLLSTTLLLLTAAAATYFAIAAQTPGEGNLDAAMPGNLTEKLVSLDEHFRSYDDTMVVQTTTTTAIATTTTTTQQKTTVPTTRPTVTSASSQYYFTLSKEAFAEVLRILHTEGRALISIEDNGDSITSLNLPIYGTVYLLTAKLNIDCKRLFDDQWNNSSYATEWNPTLQRMELLEKVSDNLKIFHQVTSPGAGGMVSSREFINLSFATLFQKKYFLVYRSVEYNVTESDDYVRAWNYPSAQIMSPIPGEPGRCSFQWLMNNDFKFSMFLSGLETQIMKFVLNNYSKHLRKRADYLNTHRSP